MGLKSGSRDAGLDESEEDDEDSTDAESNNRESKTETKSERSTTDQVHKSMSEAELETNTQPSSPPTENESTIKSTESSQSPHEEVDTTTTDDRPTMDSLPYKLRRNKVNEGREQVPYFLRKEIIDAEDDLKATLEEILGESVYKSDYREAAMVVAQQNPDLVAKVLREWGYDIE